MNEERVIAAAASGPDLRINALVLIDLIQSQVGTAAIVDRLVDNGVRFSRRQSFGRPWKLETGEFEMVTTLKVSEP